MVEKTVKIENRAGIHARPAMILVKTTLNFKSSIYLEKEGTRVNGKSIIGILTLGAAYGTDLTIIAEGEDEEEAIMMLANIINSKFEEE